MNGTWWVDPAELDDDQKEIISLGREGSFLVTGPPGSGKTNLLLLRANYLCSADRPDVLILVFTRTLREFIASGSTQYSFSPNKVQTYTSWAKKLLREHGVVPASLEDYQEERVALICQLRDLVQREHLSGLYDCVLLDEAHDYLDDEIRLVRQLGRGFFAVADTWQQIYRREQSIETLESIVERTLPLTHHYRNGLKICRLADRIMEGKGLYQPMEPTSNYNENSFPSSVNSQYCADLNEQCALIINELQTQVQAYPNELIGIICPKRNDLSRVCEILRASSLSSICTFQESDSGYMPFSTDRPICVSTVHGAKGLEFRALHFAACDTLDGFKSTNRSMTFTGVTRAKTSLSLYYSGDLYGYLEKALAALSPRRDTPDISEAFGLGE
jgi:superfamily I DNA/RNA helicase